MSLSLDICDTLSRIPKEDWNRLVSKNDPFFFYDFLCILEQSKSVGEDTGWQPLFLLLRENDQLVAALPLYLKNHSYGEYIFDWSWANAAENAGLQYYPKLVSAIPFTPVTGNRFLLLDQNNEEYKLTLWEGLKQLAKQLQVSSFHVLFTTEAEIQTFEKTELVHRKSLQFHWNNPNVSSFDEWLLSFRSKDRKKIRAERRKAKQNVDRIFWVEGSEIEQKHIDAMWNFYQQTHSRKWGRPYLTKDFFLSLQRTLKDLVHICFAEKDGMLVAGSLFFQRGTHFYGRYWGCNDHYDSLHFELCYHQAIERCLQNGWQKFEAGAQGEHKLKRGLLPTPTHSLHWMVHTGFHQAIEHFCQKEAIGIEKQIQELLTHSPLNQ